MNCFVFSINMSGDSEVIEELNLLGCEMSESQHLTLKGIRKFVSQTIQAVLPRDMSYQDDWKEKEKAKRGTQRQLPLAFIRGKVHPGGISVPLSWPNRVHSLSLKRFVIIEGKIYLSLEWGGILEKLLKHLINFGEGGSFERNNFLTLGRLSPVRKVSDQIRKTIEVGLGNFTPRIMEIEANSLVLIRELMGEFSVTTEYRFLRLCSVTPDQGGGTDTLGLYIWSPLADPKNARVNMMEGQEMMPRTTKDQAYLAQKMIEEDQRIVSEQELSLSLEKEGRERPGPRSQLANLVTENPAASALVPWTGPTARTTGLTTNLLLPRVGAHMGLAENPADSHTKALKGNMGFLPIKGGGQDQQEDKPLGLRHPGSKKIIDCMGSIGMKVVKAVDSLNDIGGSVATAERRALGLDFQEENPRAVLPVKVNETVPGGKIDAIFGGAAVKEMIEEVVKDNCTNLEERIIVGASQIYMLYHSYASVLLSRMRIQLKEKVNLTPVEIDQLVSLIEQESVSRFSSQGFWLQVRRKFAQSSPQEEERRVEARAELRAKEMQAKTDEMVEELMAQKIEARAQELLVTLTQEEDQKKQQRALPSLPGENSEDGTHPMKEEDPESNENQYEAMDKTKSEVEGASASINPGPTITSTPVSTRKEMLNSLLMRQKGGIFGGKEILRTPPPGKLPEGQ